MTIITLIKELVEEVLDAEDKFFDDIRNFGNQNICYY